MKRSTVTNAAVGIRIALILIATVGCLYKLVIVKMNRAAELDRSIASVSSEVDTNLRALKSARRLLEIERREHSDWSNRVLESIPLEPRQNELLDVLNRVASDVGLKVLNSYASDEQELGADGKKNKNAKKDRFYRIPITVEVTGGWIQMATYLRSIRELPRQVKITEFSMSRRDEFFPKSYARVSIDAFYCAPADSSKTPK